MKTSILSFIENKDSPVDSQSSYAAILGLTPSRGARSPTLWNAAFKSLRSSTKMFPLDVREENFPALIAFLKEDSRFIGGAVTMPFKAQILPLLDSIEPEARIAGAVNCFYKVKGEAKLVGTNTDGLAACQTLSAAYGNDLRGAKVLLLGLGGAGSAVAAYVAKAIGNTGLLAMANRSRAALESVEKRVAPLCKTKIVPTWPVIGADEKFDIIINASTLGFEAPREDAIGWFIPKYFTSLGPGPAKMRAISKEDAEANYLRLAVDEIATNVAASIRFLEAQRNAFVYDIIYQPKETLLLSLAKMCGCRTLNGLPMNLEQAVIAFDKTSVAAGLRESNQDEIRHLMELC